MKNLFQCLVLVSMLLVPLASNASLPRVDSDGHPLPSLSKMLKSVNPAVVNIATFSKYNDRNPMFEHPFFKRYYDQRERGDKRQPKQRQRSAGSGVIVNAKDGIVLTNFHVIKGSDEVRVSLTDGRHYVAEVLGTDPLLDIAVLKIKADKSADS